MNYLVTILATSSVNSIHEAENMAPLQAIKQVFGFSKNDPDDLTKIDRERMGKALSEEPIAMPSGLTREQKKDFILSSR